MKNIILDLIMGLLCIVLTMTILGIIVIPFVLDVWHDMRRT